MCGGAAIARYIDDPISERYANFFIISLDMTSGILSLVFDSTGVVKCYIFLKDLQCIFSLGKSFFWPIRVSFTYKN